MLEMGNTLAIEGSGVHCTSSHAWWEYLRVLLGTMVVFGMCGVCDLVHDRECTSIASLAQCCADGVLGAWQGHGLLLLLLRGS